MRWLKYLIKRNDLIKFKLNLEPEMQYDYFDRIGYRDEVQKNHGTVCFCTRTI